MNDLSRLLDLMELIRTDGEPLEDSATMQDVRRIVTEHNEAMKAAIDKHTKPSDDRPEMPL